MDYGLLKNLIDKLSDYEAQGGQADNLSAFSEWLYAHTHPAQAAAPPPAHLNQPTNGSPSETLDSVIAKLVIFLYRYAKIYIKKALEGSQLQTADEFVYLTALLNRPGLSKMELIEMSIHEKTSGMEIIKRLLARGLAVQHDHTHDRRSKCLYLTEAGRAALFPVFGPMLQVGQLVGGNLSGPEKEQLAALLQKLDTFHKPIYQHERQHNWAQLAQAYLSPAPGE